MRSFGSCSSGMFEGEGKETDIWPSSVVPDIVHDAMKGSVTELASLVPRDLCPLDL